VPAALALLAERIAAPVVEYRPRHMNFSTGHPLHGGFEVAPFLPDADVVLVLECDVPWIPSTDRRASGATVIQAGEDPLHARYPARLFPSAVTLQGSAALVIDALLAEISIPASTARRHTAEVACAAVWRASAVDAENPPARMTRAWISACLDRARAPGSILVNEYWLARGAMRVTEPGTFYGSSPAGSLGWGVPAALGIKLAAPEREVIAAVGDGSYLFANPLACHQIAAAEKIATLTVIANDQGWNAVRRATLGMYPDGAAARANVMPLTRLEAAPDYARVAEACGLFGARVADPAALPEALTRALDAVRAGRAAMLDVLCEG
jgi:acetolactate synthase-1/2/3 large subunit